ncbi:TlpA family protein disulfide reductase [Leifsonia sp. NPDC058194]|uniref:TlpA family protein disulfide reductase n=1 Tax=Leifsonia sp. NPDC058194 TaxID=3346374 RepID=UPI0036D983A3
MNGIAALGVLLALVAVATVAGLLWRATTGRARAARRSPVVRADEVGAAALGERATLLQFSTEFCALCPATSRVLDGTASGRQGVAHVEVDLTTRPDLAQRFSVLQTPTTLVLDATGAVRARIGGAVRPADVRATLDRILGSDHVSA